MDHFLLINEPRWKICGKCDQIYIEQLNKLFVSIAGAFVDCKTFVLQSILRTYRQIPPQGLSSDSNSAIGEGNQPEFQFDEFQI